MRTLPLPSASPPPRRPTIRRGAIIPFFSLLGFSAFFCRIPLALFDQLGCGAVCAGHRALLACRPHAASAGVFLFVMIGKALLAITHDINLSFFAACGARNAYHGADTVRNGGAPHCAHLAGAISCAPVSTPSARNFSHARRSYLRI